MLFAVVPRPPVLPPPTVLLRRPMDLVGGRLQPCAHPVPVCVRGSAAYRKVTAPASSGSVLRTATVRATLNPRPSCTRRAHWRPSGAVAARANQEVPDARPTSAVPRHCCHIPLRNLHGLHGAAQRNHPAARGSISPCSSRCDLPLPAHEDPY